MPLASWRMFATYFEKNFESLVRIWQTYFSINCSLILFFSFSFSFYFLAKSARNKVSIIKRIHLRLKNDKLFEGRKEGKEKASSCLANKNETPITYDRFFLPSRGLQHHFRFPRATIYPQCLSDGIGIYTIRVSGLEEKDKDGRRRGDILDCINSPRERLAATHELFDSLLICLENRLVCLLSKKNISIRIRDVVSGKIKETIRCFFMNNEL